VPAADHEVRCFHSFFQVLEKKFKFKQENLKIPEKTKRSTLTVSWLQKLENIAKESACVNNCKFAKVAKDSSICAALFKGKVQ